MLEVMYFDLLHAELERSKRINARSAPSSGAARGRGPLFTTTLMKVRNVTARARSRLTSRRILAAASTIALLLAFVAPVGTTSAATPNKAAALRWPAYVETDLQFSEFFGSPHTVMARFMPQYPRAYRGPLVTVSDGSGSYELGLGDYREGAKETPWEEVKLRLHVGGETLLYSAPSLAAGTWHHVAVVRQPLASFTPTTGRPPSTFRVYLDGQLLCGRKNILAACTHLTPSNPVAIPSGTVRMGRIAPEESSGKQFYGLIDDVAVFNKALSSAEIAQVIAAPRLDGQQAGLIAGYTFDHSAPERGLPDALNRVHTIKHEVAGELTVSSTRSNGQDAPKLPLPNPLTTPMLRLPFKDGQKWTVIQGYASEGSHNGRAAFSYDLSLSDARQETPDKTFEPSTYDHDADPSCGEPVFAAAGGRVVIAYDGGGWVDENDPYPMDDPDGPNFVWIQTRPNESLTSMHLLHESIYDAFGANLFLPPFTPHPWHVDAGDQIGQVGARNGCHLHLGLGNNGAKGDNLDGSSYTPDTVTKPAGFATYQACDANCAQEANWYKVGYGIPRLGQQVRAVK